MECRNKGNANFVIHSIVLSAEKSIISCNIQIKYSLLNGNKFVKVFCKNIAYESVYYWKIYDVKGEVESDGYNSSLY
jgi:hypothetical protein